MKNTDIKEIRLLVKKIINLEKEKKFLDDISKRIEKSKRAKKL